MIAQMILKRQFERRRNRLAELAKDITPKAAAPKAEAIKTPAKEISGNQVVVMPSRRKGKTLAAKIQEIADAPAGKRLPKPDFAKPKKLRINLNDVPSQMEQTAARWKENK